MVSSRVERYVKYSAIVGPTTGDCGDLALLLKVHVIKTPTALTLDWSKLILNSRSQRLLQKLPHKTTSDRLNQLQIANKFAQSPKPSVKYSRLSMRSNNSGRYVFVVAVGLQSAGEIA